MEKMYRILLCLVTICVLSVECQSPFVCLFVCIEECPPIEANCQKLGGNMEKLHPCDCCKTCVISEKGLLLVNVCMLIILIFVLGLGEKCGKLETYFYATCDDELSCSDNICQQKQE